jgi:outer membrane biosynthesis protein TonB
VTEHATPGRGWAYTGAILGGLASIAANVAHSFIPPATAPTGWAPEPGAVIGAIVWPVFLFIAVEILARTAWPHGRIWHLVRWAGLLPVAVVAALVSYRHMSGLLAHYGEEDLVVWLGPLAVDGLMVMATGALLATARTTTPTTQTVAVPSTVDTPRTSSTDKSEPSIADVQPSPVDTEPVKVPATEPTPIPTPATVAARITQPRPTNTPATSAAVSRPETRTTRRPRPTRPAQPATALAPSTTDHSVTASDAAQLELPVEPDLLARAAQVARQYRTEHGTPITPGQLAVRLQVSSDEATQALAVIDLGPDSPTTPNPTVNGSTVKARP